MKSFKAITDVTFNQIRPNLERSAYSRERDGTRVRTAGGVLLGDTAYTSPIRSNQTGALFSPFMSSYPWLTFAVHPNKFFPISIAFFISQKARKLPIGLTLWQPTSNKRQYHSLYALHTGRASGITKDDSDLYNSKQRVYVVPCVRSVAVVVSVRPSTIWSQIACALNIELESPLALGS